MERTAEIILSEIKECLKAVSEKLSELEALQAVKEEPTPEPEPVQEPEPEPLPVEPVEPVDLDIDLPAEFQAPAPEPAPKQEETPAPIQEEVTPPEEEMPVKGPAVLDVVTRSRAWEIDMPGSPVANILSAISLNDRLLFINTLFKKDPALFQDAVKDFNAMDSLQQALDYIAANFADWNLESDTVYRFMMAVRRKLN
ncbi:MAG: hypothetical protein II660_08980 [Bacteroidales bacterium]|nr:hypothetical protein [Bacteroidales bacterium]